MTDLPCLSIAFFFFFCVARFPRKEGSHLKIIIGVKMLETEYLKVTMKEGVTSDLMLEY